MSFPRARTPSSDVISKTSPDVNTDKSFKSLRRPFSSSPAKSKIPKQGRSTVHALNHEAESPITGADIKEDEKSSSTPRVKSPDKALSANPRTKSVTPIIVTTNQKRVMENLFTTKKKRFITLKRDIEDKQKSSQLAFDELYQLREKIMASGGKDPGKLDDLFLRTGHSFGGAGERVLGEKDLMALMESGLRPLSDGMIGFCKEVIDRRVDLFNWLQELNDKTIDNSLPRNFKEDLAYHLEMCTMDTETYTAKLETMRQEHTNRFAEVVQRINSLFHQFQLQIQEHWSAKLAEASANNSYTEDACKDLRTEKEKLQKARNKIREQEVALTSAESKLHQAQETIKHMESQMKHKDSILDHKTRELNKLQKNQENAIGKMEKQKETVETRVAKLKEELEFKDNESKTILSEYKNQIKEMEQLVESERQTRQELECEFEEFKIRHEKLEEKCKQLLDLQDKRRDALFDDQHTDYEIQLYNDLKDTQNILQEKEDLIRKLQIEREEIIAAVNEADQENDTSQERLTAELLKKSDELQTLSNQFTQLQKNYKRMQQKSDHLEHKLSEMNRIQTQMKDGSRAAYGAQVMQLQQQLTDLRSTLAESDSQNAELEKTCTQLQLKLEHYKRYMLSVEKDFNLRRDVQQLLLNKDIDGNNDIVDQSQLAPVCSEDFQQLYATLEKKEMQVMKLERLVKQMEKQEEYSQVQRTRLENRIAKLELQIKEGQQAHRNRGFSFL